MGLSAVRIGNPYRRDRLLPLNAIAIALLTLLGGAGEALGMGRLLKSNTVKRRVHSLFRQGRLYYDAIPNMPGPTLCALIERFQALLASRPCSLPGLAHGKQSHCSRVCRHLKK
jgi:hypothetical protein